MSLGLIETMIYTIRGQKVMLDMDLAKLYGVETKVLKRAVRRNNKKFPPDFMFELSKDELNDWRCQFGTSNKEKMGMRIPPS
ncbi:MAG: ORF6N domain-containing protein [Halobacteriovoraceae bacterium]|nr:ORF6N domain-containing protein [Halobacteriovoraceae bacterium]MCB9095700.1 ORF6N domain-containing protein [Halobacteriovoraceae bacterium]